MAERDDLESGRDTLIEELSRYRAQKGHRVTVVFDGGGSIHLGGSSGKKMGISVVYSPQGRTADDVIKGICRDNGADILVSADRELVQAARNNGITPLSPDRFWDSVEMEKYRQLKGLEEDDEFDEHADFNARGSAPGKKGSRKERRDRQRLSKL